MNNLVVIWKGSKILYQALYRDLKDIFGVASYKDIKQKDLEDALKYIENWIETAEIRATQGGIKYEWVNDNGKR